jgi:hypothetical protein
MFGQLHEGELPLFKLNFGVITLLPEKKNALQMRSLEPLKFIYVMFN